MKKILNISVIAALAILPMMANAAPVAGEPDGIATNPPTGQTAQNVTAQAGPKYQLAEANSAVDGVVATAGYVKGAYNAAIKAINKVSETASNALTADGTATLTNKTIDADDNTISDLETDNFKSGVVVDSTTGIAATSSASDTKLVTEKAVAKEIEDAAIQTVTAGTANGTISVDGGADVTIYDDTALAGRVTTAEGKITTLEGTVGDSNSGLVADVAALQNASGNYATKTGVTTTVTNAFTNATADLSNLGVQTGAVTGSATASVPVMANWGDTAASNTPVSATVDLTQTVAVTGLTGNTTGAVTPGTIAYPTGN